MQSKKYRDILLSDLESPESLRRWLKKNLKNIYMNNEVSNDHLLIYIDYLKSKLQDSENLDVPYWSRVVAKLKLEIEKLLELE